MVDTVICQAQVRVTEHPYEATSDFHGYRMAVMPGAGMALHVEADGLGHVFLEIPRVLGNAHVVLAETVPRDQEI